MEPVRIADRMGRIQPFFVMDLLARAQALERQGRDLVHMEVGEPDFPTPEPILHAGQQALEAGRTRYTPALGLPALRQAIAAHYGTRFALDLDPGCVAVTPGASGALLLALANRRLDRRVLRGVVLQTMNTSAYIFAIFIGATVFALVLRVLGGDELIQSALGGLGLGPEGLILFVLFMVFLLGFFLDWIEISLIILPLLGPVVAGLDLPIPGYGVVEQPRLVWFALLVAATLQTSFLTPPVGFALFYLKGVCPPEVRLLDIYRGVVPFILLQLLGVALVFLFPGLTTWLPALAYGH